VLYRIQQQVIETKTKGRLLFRNIDADEENSPKNIVQNMAQNYADKWVAKPLLYSLQRRLPINIPPPTPFLQRKSLFIKC
jgi:hypothetical protein